MGQKAILRFDHSSNTKSLKIENFIYSHIATSKLLFTAYDVNYDDDIFAEYEIAKTPKSEPESSSMPRIREFADFISQEIEMGRALSLQPIK